MNKILLLLALSVPVLFAYDVHAAPGDFWVDANIASYHTNASGYCYEGKCDDFNQFNYGLGMSYEMDKLIEWQAGFFRNSYDKHSNYAAIKFNKHFNVGSIRLTASKTYPVRVTPGVSVGVVTGYEHTEVEAAPLQPMALPSVAVAVGDVRVVVGYIPFSFISENSEVDVITFQAGYRF